MAQYRNKRGLNEQEEMPRYSKKGWIGLGVQCILQENAKTLFLFGA